MIFVLKDSSLIVHDQNFWIDHLLIEVFEPKLFLAKLDLRKPFWVSKIRFLNLLALSSNHGFLALCSCMKLSMTNPWHALILKSRFPSLTSQYLRLSLRFSDFHLQNDFFLSLLYTRPDSVHLLLSPAFYSHFPAKFWGFLALWSDPARIWSWLGLNEGS